jgi:predicted membrane channel-forming protein YqfA (hemolysin III family)
MSRARLRAVAAPPHKDPALLARDAANDPQRNGTVEQLAAVFSFLAATLCFTFFLGLKTLAETYETPQPTKMGVIYLSTLLFGVVSVSLGCLLLLIGRAKYEIVVLSRRRAPLTRDDKGKQAISVLSAVAALSFFAVFFNVSALRLTHMNPSAAVAGGIYLASGLLGVLSTAPLITLSVLKNAK